MNISPKQYILQKKLALANKLMDEGVPRTVVAMQVGYENYSNFYRLYRKNAEKIRSEFVVGVEGVVRERAKETVNPNLKTGEIEIIASNLVIYSKAETPPFYIEDGIEKHHFIENIKCNYF